MWGAWGVPAGGLTGLRMASGGRRVVFWSEDLAKIWRPGGTKPRASSVLARNWQCREGELDIVARRARLLVFCEVKARTTDTFGVPAEAVGPLKQAKVRRLAALWFAAQARSSGGSRQRAGRCALT